MGEVGVAIVEFRRVREGVKFSPFGIYEDSLVTREIQHCQKNPEFINFRYSTPGCTCLNPGFTGMFYGDKALAGLPKGWHRSR